jgi:hypothetical protein
VSRSGDSAPDGSDGSLVLSQGTDGLGHSSSASSSDRWCSQGDTNRITPPTDRRHPYDAMAARLGVTASRVEQMSKLTAELGDDQ